MQPVYPPQNQIPQRVPPATSRARDTRACFTSTYYRSTLLLWVPAAKHWLAPVSGTMTVPYWRRDATLKSDMDATENRTRHALATGHAVSGGGCKRQTANSPQSRDPKTPPISGCEQATVHTHPAPRHHGTHPTFLFPVVVSFSTAGPRSQCSPRTVPRNPPRERAKVLAFKPPPPVSADLSREFAHRARPEMRRLSSRPPPGGGPRDAPRRRGYRHSATWQERGGRLVSRRRRARPGSPRSSTSVEEAPQPRGPALRL